MDELPLHPSAEAAIGTGEVVRDLAAALAAGGGTAAELLAALAPVASSPDASGSDASGSVAPGPVARADLVAAASLESDRLGDVLVRPEHLVLGWARLTGSDPARVREELQWLMAGRAYARYEALRPLPRDDGAPPPRAVLLAGVPGTGKSTLAEALARRLRAPVFSVDWQLGALVPFGALRLDNTLPLAETTLVASLARQLQLGLDVVVDATGHRRELRSRLRSVTEALGGVFVGVECVCSDEAVQRRRVEGRDRGIPGWHATVSWEHVLRMRSAWESWDEPHLVVDSAVQTPGGALAAVLGAVAR